MSALLLLRPLPQFCPASLSLSCSYHAIISKCLISGLQDFLNGRRKACLTTLEGEIKDSVSTKEQERRQWFMGMFGSGFKKLFESEPRMIWLNVVGEWVRQSREKINPILRHHVDHQSPPQRQLNCRKLITNGNPQISLPTMEHAACESY